MKWEYRVEHIPYLPFSAERTELRRLLNELGREGWELVGIIPPINNATNNSVTLILKRGEVKIDGK